MEFKQSNIFAILRSYKFQYRTINSCVQGCNFHDNITKPPHYFPSVFKAYFLYLNTGGQIPLYTVYTRCHNALQAVKPNARVRVMI